MKISYEYSLIINIESYARENAQLVLCVFQLQWHINDLYQFYCGTVAGKKPLNYNFQQGFGQ